MICVAVTATLLGGCGSKAEDPQPSPPVTAAPTITVTVSEAGAPDYPLREAKVVSSNYQTGSSDLTITGKLNNGKALTLIFSRGTGTPPPYSTAGLEAALDGIASSTAMGTTTYSPTTRKVNGNFQLNFPGTGALSGSFTGLQL